MRGLDVTGTSWDSVGCDGHIMGQRGLDVTGTSCDSVGWMWRAHHVMTGQRGLDVMGTSCDHGTAWAGTTWDSVGWM